MKAYVFPGQGSQFPGMAKDLYDNYELARTLLSQADEVLGFSISKVMFEGSDEDLRATAVTQPAVFLHSYLEFACKAESAPDMVAGHSLGEFSALAAAGVLQFSDALSLVSARAKAMQKCCEKVPGSMAAVINLAADEIERICMEINDGAGLGALVAANFNSDAQTVISGTAEAVAEACVRLKAAGARRALVLPVGGAFHSPLMEPARAELAEAIKRTSFASPCCPVYQNVVAAPVSDPEVMKANLLQQLTAPVRWAQSVRQMASDGAVEFIECGPGAVLEGLIRKTLPASEDLVVRHV